MHALLVPGKLSQLTLLLLLQAGDIITELESVDEDWMSGELQGKSGIFPKNFVQILRTP